MTRRCKWERWAMSDLEHGLRAAEVTNGVAARPHTAAVGLRLAAATCARSAAPEASSSA